ncbi:thiol:disulfide interchange protein [Betaproteobacteria bacterium]|nr:thiol:disulfide interchange protein [Betaproteobacteria bacterium]
MNNKYIWILVAFALLVVLLGYGLTLNPREIPSPFIGKAAPDFSLPQLGKEATFAPADLQGKVWLLNVWASWCPSCRVEHPVLVDLAKRDVLPIVGLNYKEVRGDGALDSSKIAPEEEKQLATERAQKWLAQHGDPYALSVLDLDGRVGIDYGVYGAPETFLIDKAGVIRFKQIGPITPEALETTLLPLIAELNQ